MAGLSPGTGQLPPLAFTRHFPLGRRSSELGPLPRVGWADGGCSGTRRNLITLVKLTLTATVPLKCRLIHLFRAPHYPSLDGAADVSVQLTSMPLVFLTQHLPFPLGSRPRNASVVQGWKWTQSGQSENRLTLDPVIGSGGGHVTQVSPIRVGV